MIAVIDYGAGNLRSIENALRKLNAESILVSDANILETADKAIFPGVGNFASVMLELRARGLDNAIRKFIESGKPFLGICLGMQALFEESEESANERGLGILEGNVVKLQGKIKIPQMGWNNVRFKKGKKLFRGIPQDSFAYFVHSYCARPDDEAIAAAETVYGSRFCSALECRNIFAVQFHPEKSGEIGLQMLRNFLEV